MKGVLVRCSHLNKRHFISSAFVDTCLSALICIELEWGEIVGSELCGMLLSLKYTCTILWKAGKDVKTFFFDQLQQTQTDKNTRSHENFRSNKKIVRNTS